MSDDRHPTIDPRPRSTIGIAVGAVVVVVVAVVVLIIVGVVVRRPSVDEEGGPSSTHDTAPVTPEPPSVEQPFLSEPMPLAPRVEPAVVLAGDRLVVWGGVSDLGPFDQPVEVLTDGAVLDLGSGTWRVLPESPFPTPPASLPDEVGLPQGVSTEAGVVVVSGGVSALWEPTADAWQVMDPPPGEVGTLWSDGHQVFSASANARLDVDTGTWHPLPEPPLGLTDAVSAWTGREVAVVGMVTPSEPGAQSYDPSTDAWRVLADLPPGVGALGSGSVLSAGWDGRHLIVHHGGSNQVLAHDPVADRWDELPPTSGRGLQWSPATVTSVAGRPLLMLADTMVLLDDDRWRTVPYGWVEGDSIIDLPRLAAVRGPGRSTVLVLAAEATGHRVVVLSMDVMVVSEQRRIPVGSITIELPETHSVSRLHGRGGDQPSTVYLEGGDDSCSVMAGAIDDQVTSIGPEVVVDHGGDRRTWTRHPLGQNWLYFDDDLGVAISCLDPDVSEHLARSVRFT